VKNLNVIKAQASHLNTMSNIQKTIANNTQVTLVNRQAALAASLSLGKAATNNAQARLDKEIKILKSIQDQNKLSGLTVNLKENESKLANLKAQKDKEALNYLIKRRELLQS